MRELVYLLQVYFQLMLDDRFINLRVYKIVLLKARICEIDDNNRLITQWVTLHGNALFKDGMDLSDYFEQIKEYLFNLYKFIMHAIYVSDKADIIRARVYNLNNMANRSIKINPNPWGWVNPNNEAPKNIEKIICPMLTLIF